MSTRVRRSREEIALLLEELSSSSKTQREFARDRGIALSTLSSWLRRGRQPNQRRESAQIALPVKVSAAPTGGSRGQSFEVRLPSQVEIAVPQAFDPRALRELLRAVSHC